MLRDLSQWAFPDPQEPADEPAPIDTAVLQRRREFAATETAALYRTPLRRPDSPTCPPHIRDCPGRRG
ncbi:hypothetical protein [Streptomyces sp. NPDC051567]|uniref:hypothetical protein n=1 Tax=Streptomyces sp. NPDC051567 TaxID=3365660 RepID=UPI0037B5A7DD